MIIKTFNHSKVNTYNILTKGHKGTLLRNIIDQFCYFSDVEV